MAVCFFSSLQSRQCFQFRILWQWTHSFIWKCLIFLSKKKTMKERKRIFRGNGNNGYSGNITVMQWVLKELQSTLKNTHPHIPDGWQTIRNCHRASNDWETDVIAVNDTQCTLNNIIQRIFIAPEIKLMCPLSRHVFQHKQNCANKTQTSSVWNHIGGKAFHISMGLCRLFLCVFRAMDTFFRLEHELFHWHTFMFFLSLSLWRSFSYPLNLTKWFKSMSALRAI